MAGKCGKGNGSLKRRLTACFLRRHYPDRFYGFRWRGLSCLREQAALRQEKYEVYTDLFILAKYRLKIQVFMEQNTLKK